jgi:hypothetical protein
VDRLVEYFQATRMSALPADVAQENVSLLTLEKTKTGADILSVAKLFFPMFGNKMFCRECSRMFRLKVFHHKMQCQCV